MFIHITRKVDEAFGVLDKMMENDSALNLYTHKSLTIISLNNKKMEQEQKLFQAMHAHGCTPTSFTCNIFMDYYVKEGEFHEAYHVFI
jgi:hypothetical protein